jgi:hypothetical protein
MVLIRRVEERLRDESAAGKLPGAVHLYSGEEAVAVGVCAHLEDREFRDLDPPWPRSLPGEGRRAEGSTRVVRGTETTTVARQLLDARQCDQSKVPHEPLPVQEIEGTHSSSAQPAISRSSSATT